MTAKEQAMLNDKKLIDLATYAISAGQTRLFDPRDPGLMDEVQDKFNYYKLLVRSKEITLDELEDKVYRYSPFCHQTSTNLLLFNYYKILSLQNLVQNQMI